MIVMLLESRGEQWRDRKHEKLIVRVENLEVRKASIRKDKAQPNSQGESNRVAHAKMDKRGN